MLRGWSSSEGRGGGGAGWREMRGEVKENNGSIYTEDDKIVSMIKNHLKHYSVRQYKHGKNARR